MLTNDYVVVIQKLYVCLFPNLFNSVQSMYVSTFNSYKLFPAKIGVAASSSSQIHSHLMSYTYGINQYSRR
jgi:hypothetical protein